MELQKALLPLRRKIRKGFKYSDIKLIDFDSVFDISTYQMVTSFKPERGSFKRYCYLYIYRAVADEINKMTSVLKVPIKTARKIYKISEDEWYKPETKENYKLTTKEAKALQTRPYKFYCQREFVKPDIKNESQMEDLDTKVDVLMLLQTIEDIDTKSILVMYYLDGLTIAEIAKKIGRSPRFVSRRLA